jgi:hypothetical protein
MKLAARQTLLQNESIMSGSSRVKVRTFTIDQLRRERQRVVSAARQREGAIVVDKKGERRFSIWIPQGAFSKVD